MPAGESIGEPTEEGGEEHIAEEKSGGEEADLAFGVGVIGEQVFGDEGFDGGEDVAVDIIEKINSEEEGEGEPR